MITHVYETQDVQQFRDIKFYFKDRNAISNVSIYKKRIASRHGSKSTPQQMCVDIKTNKNKQWDVTIQQQGNESFKACADFIFESDQEMGRQSPHVDLQNLEVNIIV